MRHIGKTRRCGRVCFRVRGGAEVSARAWAESECKATVVDETHWRKCCTVCCRPSVLRLKSECKSKGKDMSTQRVTGCVTGVGESLP
eukprot:1160466-Pelagomonas_calceolata.AAC.2